MRAHTAVLAILALAACGDDGGAPDPLYDRLGGESGIQAIVEGWVAAAYADPAIDGYLANSSVDRERMVRCMALQLDAASGGPQTYPGAACQASAAAHAGLGVSHADFAAMAADLEPVLAERGVDAATRADLMTLIGAGEGDVVEDPTSDATVYQRVGRKPAISAAVTAFESRVAADATVNGFFAGVQDFTRLHACLTRQLCAIDGPCRYGEELASEFPGLSNQAGCRAMGPTHAGLHDPGGLPITIDDFNEIALDLATTLDEAGVAPADRDAIIGAIAPLCAQIVAGGTGCP